MVVLVVVAALTMVAMLGYNSSGKVMRWVKKLLMILMSMNEYGGR